MQNFADLHSIQLHLIFQGFLLRENNVSCLTQLHVFFIACLEIITDLIHNISIFHVEIYMKFNDIFKISDCGLLKKKQK